MLQSHGVNKSSVIEDKKRKECKMRLAGNNLQKYAKLKAKDNLAESQFDWK